MSPHPEQETAIVGGRRFLFRMPHRRAILFSVQ